MSYQFIELQGAWIEGQFLHFFEKIDSSTSMRPWFSDLGTFAFVDHFLQLQLLANKRPTLVQLLLQAVVESEGTRRRIFEKPLESIR
jgi:hypothetical protein